MRARDRLGRPVPAGSAEAVPEVPADALAPLQALALAQSLLEEDRAFSAHEVLEASWKAAPEPERDLWQGLAQLAVGVTHVQRGNGIGGARLLRRGADHLPAELPFGLDPALPSWAVTAAQRIESGDLAVPRLRLLR